MIYVDAREPLIYRELGEAKPLPCDFLIVGEHRKYAVERKTITDYWNSVVNGRLWNQLRELERLRDEEGYIPLLLVVGSWGKVMRMLKLSLPHILGAQVALSTFGVTPLYVSNKQQAVAAIRYLDSKAGQTPTRHRVTIPKPVERSIEEERLDVLCAIRGIGPKTAEEMLRLGSLRSLFSMSVEELEPVIGRRRAEHFVEVVGVEGLDNGSSIH